MTASLTDLLSPTPPEPEPGSVDAPRSIDAGLSPADRIFRGSARGIGVFVLILVGAIGLFLFGELVPTLKHYGLHFFTEPKFVPGLNVIGIGSAVVGTIEVAIVALLVAFPLALGTALFISEFAPKRVRYAASVLVDGMATIPSVVWGIWGAYTLQPYLEQCARWLTEWLGWIPIFKVTTPAPASLYGAHGAQISLHYWGQSVFTAGVVVGLMIVPISCAVMIGVFGQAPLGEREAAYALGSTRWGMVRSVVLPFGRGGIIGGTMLGLGRALGETVAVLLIINTVYTIDAHPLQSGTNTISAQIAGGFGEATGVQLDSLLAAGFVLFVMTLVINTIAGRVVSRSRSGASTDI